MTTFTIWPRTARERPRHTAALEGSDPMSSEEIKEFELTLLDFVKRAASEKATAEEVEALPAVAQVLVNVIRDI